MLSPAFLVVFVNAVEGFDFYLVVGKHKSDETTFQFPELFFILQRLDSVSFSALLLSLAVYFLHIFIVCVKEIGGGDKFRRVGITSEAFQHTQIVIPR